ncbi:MAG: carboxypeptidase-like regulatory domain-containing protein [Bacteroidales bacterium]|nr:carboxypeptidase-like regulatory domain-containing protein [Bacteroidales bacterium]
MVRILIICLALLVGEILVAQEQPRIVIEGEVKDTLYAPVPFVNVLVAGRNEGCAGDLYGKFRIPVYPGDVLVISSVSYKTARLRIPDTLTAEKYWLKVILTADTLLLNEVTISPPAVTWEEYKETELAMDLPEFSTSSLTRIYRKEDLDWLFSNHFGMAPGPASILYSLFGKRPKEERELRAVLYREELEERIVRRYNPYVVSRLTGMKSEATIVQLMKFCNLDLSFILVASDYDFYSTIMQCYRAYQIPNSKHHIPDKSQDPNSK